MGRGRPMASSDDLVEVMKALTVTTDPLRHDGGDYGVLAIADRALYSPLQRAIGAHIETEIQYNGIHYRLIICRKNKPRQDPVNYDYPYDDYD